MGQRRDRWRSGAARRTLLLVLRGPSALIDGQDPLAAVGAERWPPPMLALLAATAPESVLVNRILRLGALPTWTRGTVALLGDAAHAMEPNLGQGAAETIEDAETLLVALRVGGELSGALAAYADARRPRARMFQRESSRFAHLALSTHTGPRDLLMRLSPEVVRRRAMERLLRRHAPPRPAPRQARAQQSSPEPRSWRAARCSVSRMASERCRTALHRRTLRRRRAGLRDESARFRRAAHRRWPLNAEIERCATWLPGA
jgi:hypothetical protein